MPSPHNDNITISQNIANNNSQGDLSEIEAFMKS